MNETFVIHATTNNSSANVGTQSAGEALKKARDMMGPDSSVTITDRDGNHYTVDELDDIVMSGDFAKPNSSRR
jgi:hypothetical protein